MKNLFLYGSCVSRDSYDFLDRNDFKLVDYVSRQSIISTYSPVSDSYLSIEQMNSPFQIRNAQGDFLGDLWQRYDSKDIIPDLFIWDIIDERNGVVEFDANGYVTFSYDLFRADVFKVLAAENVDFRRVLFGTDEHFERWCSSVKLFLADLHSRGISDRLVLLIAPWAVQDNLGGTPNFWNQGPGIAEANALYSRYYTYLVDDMNVPSITIPQHLAVTKRDHKWGPAAYHYIDGAYEFLVSKIMDMTSK